MTAVRRLRASPATLLMWIGCFLGMTLGLAFDCRSTTLEALAMLCTSGSGSLASNLVRHFAQLPGANIGMLLGGLAALGMVEVGARRALGIEPPVASATQLGAGLFCNLAMLVGMSIACCTGATLAAQFGMGWSGPAMLVAMAAGMTGGIAVAKALARLASGSNRRAWRLA
jgi:uncharacterized membrane-anchored protein